DATAAIEQLWQHGKARKGIRARQQQQLNNNGKATDRNKQANKQLHVYMCAHLCVLGAAGIAVGRVTAENYVNGVVVRGARAVYARLHPQSLVTNYYKAVDFSLWPLVGFLALNTRHVHSRVERAVGVEIINPLPTTTVLMLGPRHTYTLSCWRHCLRYILFRPFDHFYAIFMQFQYKNVVKIERNGKRKGNVRRSAAAATWLRDTIPYPLVKGATIAAVVVIIPVTIAIDGVVSVVISNASFMVAIVVLVVMLLQKLCTLHFPFSIASAICSNIPLGCGIIYTLMNNNQVISEIAVALLCISMSNSRK
ncbi:unnamed protein product, partial [Ceratitis capitata]